MPLLASATSGPLTGKSPVRSRAAWRRDDESGRPRPRPVRMPVAIATAERGRVRLTHKSEYRRCSYAALRLLGAMACFQ